VNVGFEPTIVYLFFASDIARTTMPKTRLKPMPSARSCPPFALLAFLVLLLFSAPSRSLSQQNPPPEFESLVAPGVEALKSGDLDTAEQIFSSALRKGIRHPLVYHNLGVIAQQRGKHAEAVAWFREALSLQPDFGPSHLLLGSSLLALKKSVEAQHELRRAVTSMPQEPQARLQLAKAYEASDNWIAAVQQLQKLVDLAPLEPEYSYQLGRAWTKLSDWSYQQISQVNRHSARLQQALGQEYAIQVKYDQALAAFQKAAELDPKLPEIHLAIALLCLELKKLDEAQAAIGVELSLVPESKAALDAKAKIEAARTAAAPPTP
jgi:tetratricopeptide (TPR) repeat protein